LQGSGVVETFLDGTLVIVLHLFDCSLIGLCEALELVWRQYLVLGSSRLAVVRGRGSDSAVLVQQLWIWTPDRNHLLRAELLIFEMIDSFASKTNSGGRQCPIECGQAVTAALQASVADLAI
jgi:hypothetical protein